LDGVGDEEEGKEEVEERRKQGLANPVGQDH
jgi:hypothetical protein